MQYFNFGFLLLFQINHATLGHVSIQLVLILIVITSFFLPCFITVKPGGKKVGKTEDDFFERLTALQPSFF